MNTNDNPVIDQRAFRDAMGHFCTGVVIVTGVNRGVPVAFTAQSFVSLSLDPPLIAVCPGKTSTSWPPIRESGRFCINILGADQTAVCLAMSKSGSDKFAGVPWAPSPLGSPVLDRIVGHIDCELHAEHDAGDHVIAVGRVSSFVIDPATSESPLLFFKGKFGGFEPNAT